MKHLLISCIILNFLFFLGGRWRIIYGNKKTSFKSMSSLSSDLAESNPRCNKVFICLPSGLSLPYLTCFNITVQCTSIDNFPLRIQKEGIGGGRVCLSTSSFFLIILPVKICSSFICTFSFRDHSFRVLFPHRSRLNIHSIASETENMGNINIFHTPVKSMLMQQ